VPPHLTFEKYTKRDQSVDAKMKSLFNTSRRLAVTLLIVGVLAGGANAALIINMTESNGMVTVDIDGSLDLSGATLAVINGKTNGVIPNGLWYIASGSGSAEVSGYLLTSFDGSFGDSQSFIQPDMTSGDDVGIFQNAGNSIVFVPNGYVSGSSISSSMTFAGQTISSLGATLGTYNYAIPDDTITLNISIVPEPSSALLLGLAASGLVVRRRGIR
jgi:PEP-CTERM motif